MAVSRETAISNLTIMCNNLTPNLCLNFGYKDTSDFAKPEDFVKVRKVPAGIPFNPPVAVPAYQSAGYGIKNRGTSPFALMGKPLIENPYNIRNAPAQKVKANQYALFGPSYTLTAVKDDD